MIHGSEQQILIKIRTTKSFRNLRIFCPLLGTVHYWGLLLNKNGWEAGFCPLLGAFPLLGSALLGEYSVYLKAILRFLLVSNELTRDKKLLAVNL